MCEGYLNLEIITCDPLLYTMNHPRFIVSNLMEEFVSIQGLTGLKLRACNKKKKILITEPKHICCWYSKQPSQ